MNYGNSTDKLENSRATAIDAASDALANMRLKLLASTHVNSELKNYYSQIASAFKDNATQISEGVSKSSGSRFEISHKDATSSAEWITRAFIASVALMGIIYITAHPNFKEDGVFVGLVCVCVCFVFLIVLVFKRITVVGAIEPTSSHQRLRGQKIRFIYPRAISSQGYIFREYLSRTSNLPQSLKSERVGWHELLRRNRISGYPARHSLKI